MEHPAKPDTVSVDSLPPLLTVDEVGQLLRCTPITCYRLAARGRLPSVKIGSLVRFPREKILAFMAGGAL